MRTKLSFVRFRKLSWVKHEEHPFRISALELWLGLLGAPGMLILTCYVFRNKRVSSIGIQGFLCKISSSRPTATVDFSRSRIQVISNIFKSCSKTFCFWGFLWQLLLIWKVVKQKTKRLYPVIQDKHMSNSCMWYLGIQA